jgi:hypothetical protein
MYSIYLLYYYKSTNTDAETPALAPPRRELRVSPVAAGPLVGTPPANPATTALLLQKYKY